VGQVGDLLARELGSHQRVLDSGSEGLKATIRMAPTTRWSAVRMRRSAVAAGPEKGPNSETASTTAATVVHMRRGRATRGSRIEASAQAASPTSAATTATVPAPMSMGGFPDMAGERRSYPTNTSTTSVITTATPTAARTEDARLRPEARDGDATADSSMRYLLLECLRKHINICVRMQMLGSLECRH